jgi:hypothetical protein
MARLKRSKNGGLDVFVGKLTPAQEMEFYERFGAAPVAWFRGSSPNLGAPRSQGQEGQPQPSPAKPRGRCRGRFSGAS